MNQDMFNAAYTVISKVIILEWNELERNGWIRPPFFLLATIRLKAWNDTLTVNLLSKYCIQSVEIPVFTININKSLHIKYSMFIVNSGWSRLL